jgi:hypothetical protein
VALAPAPTPGRRAISASTIARSRQNNQAVYPGDTLGLTVFQVSRSRIIANITGIAAGANSTIRVSDSVIEGNTYGINLGPGGTLESAGNNVFRGNVNFEPPLTTFALR